MFALLLPDTASLDGSPVPPRPAHAVLSAARQWPFPLRSPGVALPAPHEERVFTPPSPARGKRLPSWEGKRLSSLTTGSWFVRRRAQAPRSRLPGLRGELVLQGDAWGGRSREPRGRPSGSAPRPAPRPGRAEPRAAAGARGEGADGRALPGQAGPTRCGCSGMGGIRRGNVTTGRLKQGPARSALSIVESDVRKGVPFVPCPPPLPTLAKEHNKGLYAA